MAVTRMEPLVREGVLLLPPAPAGASVQTDPSPGINEMTTLADAYRGGVRRVLAIDGGSDLVWHASVASFHALLISRGLPGMILREVEARSDRARAIGAIFAEVETARARRSLFGAGADGGETPPTSALVELQAVNADRDGALFAAAPVIDPDLCTGCDACMRVCPTGVLTLIKDAAYRETYACTPASCDACGLCGEVCSVSAIRLAKMTRSPDEIALRGWVCRACGTAAHAPKLRDHGDDLCFVCKATGHHKKLFQVLP